MQYNQETANPNGHREQILVVADRKLFRILLRSFSCDNFEVLYAEEPAPAVSFSAASPPRLVTVPCDGDAGVELAVLLKEINDEIVVVGTTKKNRGLRDTHQSLDRVVNRADLHGVASAVRRLVGERRRRPRVPVDFLINLAGSGQAVVRDISAISLLVETQLDFEEGERLLVEIGDQGPPYQFEARVGRVWPGPLEDKTLVLMVPERAVEVRRYIQSLVLKLMEVQYHLNGISPGEGILRGPACWGLKAQKPRSPRQPAQGGDSKQAPGAALPDSEKVPEAGRMPDVSLLKMRYRVGKNLGLWGVGNVHSAKHSMLKRPVVLKILRDELKDSDTARARMEQEATNAALVTGASMVNIVDLGDDGHGGLFYAMEALRGETLATSVLQGVTFSPLDVEIGRAHV